MILTELPIQIGKVQINVQVSLASLPCIACWFHFLSFMLFVFSMNQKEEFTFPISFTQSKKLFNESFICSKQKKHRVKMSYIDFSGFCEKHIFTDRRLPLCFKKWSCFRHLSIKSLSFPEQNTSILKYWNSFLE